MALPGLERKALFKAEATRRRVTLEEAAREGCGVSWFHLLMGIEGRRPLGAEARKRFAEYIHLTVEEVFGRPLDVVASLRSMRERLEAVYDAVDGEPRAGILTLINDVDELIADIAADEREAANDSTVAGGDA